MRPVLSFAVLSSGFVAVLALLGPFAGCLSVPSSTGRVAVGTYNIRLSPGDKNTPNAWLERRADLVALIRKLDLDAFGLQEVCPDQAQYLREQLPDYAFVGDHRGSDRKSDEASPVFYRKSRFEAIKSGTFWLSETPEAPGVKGWGAACPRVCSWAWLKDRATGRTLCFANTHTDHRSVLARKEGMLLIVRRMRDFCGGAPIVFTGDHNCRENDEPAREVSKLLDNALLVSASAPVGPWRTWNGWRWRDAEVATADALALGVEGRNAHDDDGKWTRFGGPRIDYIYVSKGVRVLDYATRGDARPGQKLYPSDHFPVTATIEY